MRSLLFLLFWFFSVGGIAQTYKQFIKWGDDNAQKGDYYGASLYYKKALDIDSIDVKLFWKYAESLRKYNNYQKAEYYYAKIFDREEGMLYPESIFYLATMKKFNGHYKEAQDLFKKANKRYTKDRKGYLYLKTKKEIQSCGFALKESQKHDTTGYKFYNAGKNINSYDSEFGIALSDTALLFSSMRGKDERGDMEIYDPVYKVGVFSARGKGKTYDMARSLGEIINNPAFHNGDGAFSGDGKRFFFTRCDSLSNCNIFVTYFTNGKWQPAVALPSEINTSGHTTSHPACAQIDGKEYLFFSSDRSGGQGKRDIWYCEMQAGERYSKPKNAGKQVNSIDDEITPSYDEFNNVLYFSSNWHEGFGGFDAFKSDGKPERLGAPVNLGYPINTQWNDMYYRVDKQNRFAYLASNRLGSYFKKSPTCCNDIYIAEFPVVEPPKDTIPYQSLKELNDYLPVTLYFHNDEPNPRVEDTTTRLNYMTTYEAYTALIDKYRKEYSSGLDSAKAKKARNDIEAFFTDYVDKGVHDLEVFTKLLLEELKKGYEIELTVKGFASPLAKTDYNVHLTKRRIASLINYLREYNSGEFLPYLNGTAQNGAKLFFVKIPFGEYTAATTVSDNFHDTKNSVYSRAAALERKIEIQTVQHASKDSVLAEFKVDKEAHDFGASKPGDVLEHEFVVKNTGKGKLKIENIFSFCDCISGVATKTELEEGESTTIKVKFNSAGYSGMQVRSVTVVTNGFPPNKRLVVTTEIK
ncbi:MAG: DUF1573 domain-containing protein [Flavobacteriales bacterium]